jgi:hypothetical protein
MLESEEQIFFSQGATLAMPRQECSIGRVVNVDITPVTTVIRHSGVAPVQSLKE